MKRRLLILAILAQTATSLLLAQNPMGGYTPADLFLERATWHSYTYTNPYAASLFATSSYGTYAPNEAFPTYGACPATHDIDGRRNAVGDDPFGGGDIGDVKDPNEPGTPLPIGDVPIGFFMLLAGVCAAVIWRKRTQSPS